MAEKDLDAPNGSVSVVINLAKAKDGNKALASARVEAVQLAKQQGRRIEGDTYGTSRDGDMLTVSFPLAAL